VRKVLNNGKAHYSVPDAARILKITKNKVRELLGKGDLESAQFRMNGKIFVTAKSIVDYSSPASRGGGRAPS
jgi:hypothetical protein